MWLNLAGKTHISALNRHRMFLNWTSRGERVHWSHDQKYTAHLCVLSKPALHLVKACLSKPIWAYRCAPREGKQGPHALTYKNHLAGTIVLREKEKHKNRSQVGLSHLAGFRVWTPTAAEEQVCWWTTGRCACTLFSTVIGWCSMNPRRNPCDRFTWDDFSPYQHDTLFF